MTEPVAVGLIWAEAAGGVIGRAGGLPWHLPEDQTHFRDTTLDTSVLMGRRTWESLPSRFRPLPGRRNVVLTRNPDWSDAGAEVAESVPTALQACRGQVWVVGGAQVYRAALPYASLIVRTQLEQAVDGDAYAPALDSGWRCVDRDPLTGWRTSRTGLRYRITRWVKSTELCDPDHILGRD